MPDVEAIAQEASGAGGALPNSRGPKYHPVGGCWRQATERRRELAETILDVARARSNELVTVDELLDSVRGLPGQPVEDTVRRTIRNLASRESAFVKIARDTYSWAPDGLLPSLPIPEHVKKMLELRLAGKTLDEIGKEFGVTRERARQLLKKHGGPRSADVRQIQVDRAQADEIGRRAPIVESIRATLALHGPMSVEEMASRAGMEQVDAANCWPPDLAHLRMWPVGSQERRWSDEDVLAAIREAAVYEFPLTSSAYKELRTVGQIEGPSAARIGQRFGSWTAACDAAGVVVGAAVRDNYESRWSDQDLLKVVRQYLMDPVAPNSMNGFDAWKRLNVPDGPSGRTLRKRFGSWAAVKRMAFTTEEW